MCGLAGMARHPEAPEFGAAKIAFEELMGGIEKRGRHATGLAVGLASERKIVKRAVNATTMMASAIWRETMDTLPPDTRVLIGHTRYATHQNAHLDEAAHPFEIGKIVGAHNGIVYNWIDALKQMKWPTPMIVDSQAMFAALDKIKDPAKALDLFDGYWALTWMKGRSLFLTRCSQAPLAVAYVPTWRTLFWASEKIELDRVMLRLGEKYESWEATPNTIYRYTPSSFETTGTGVEKIAAAFAGRKRSYGRVNSAKPGQQDALPVSSKRGAVVKWGERWNPFTGEEEWGPRSTMSTSSTSKPERKYYSLTEIDADVQAIQRVVRMLALKVQALEKENEYLTSVLVDYGVIEPIEEEDDGEEPEVGQGSLFPDTPMPKQRCSLCGNDEEKERLLTLPDGKQVHQRCVLAKVGGPEVSNIEVQRIEPAAQADGGDE